MVYNKEYYLKNKETFKKVHYKYRQGFKYKEWREKNRDKHLLYKKEWVSNHSESVRKYFKKYCKSKRMKLIELLGGKCVKCDITNPLVLHFDHIHNDGNKDLKRGVYLYYYYIKHPEEAKEKLQVLCANCHNIKTYTISGDT